MLLVIEIPCGTTYKGLLNALCFFLTDLAHTLHHMEMYYLDISYSIFSLGDVKRELNLFPKWYDALLVLNIVSEWYTVVWFEDVLTQWAQNIESTLINGYQSWFNVDSTLFQHWTEFCAHWEGAHLWEEAISLLRGNGIKQVEVKKRLWCIIKCAPNDKFWGIYLEESVNTADITNKI